MDLAEELSKLHPEEQVEEITSDASFFTQLRENRKKNKKKKKDLFSEVYSALDDDQFDKYYNEFTSEKRKKKSKSDSVDGDLFDTKGKSSKKTKNLEAKFKSEFAALSKLLKDNEETTKTIKEVLAPIMNSKARGSSKMLVDLLMSLNSSNSNRLSVLKEIGTLKKAIIDLNIKMSKDDKNKDEMPADQFGSGIFDRIFKQGRTQVIDTANQFDQAYDDYIQQNSSFEEICNDRLSNETNSYRSADGNKMIEYEALQPEVCIQKYIDGTCEVVAIGNDGVIIDDYPVPYLADLGKLSFNMDTHTCTDMTGRTFRVIEV